MRVKQLLKRDRLSNVKFTHERREDHKDNDGLNLSRIRYWDYGCCLLFLISLLKLDNYTNSQYTSKILVARRVCGSQPDWPTVTLTPPSHMPTSLAFQLTLRQTVVIFIPYINISDTFGTAEEKEKEHIKVVCNSNNWFHTKT